MAEKKPSMWSYRVGRVGGVEIRVHVTMLLLLALVVAASTSRGDGAVAAVVWLTLLFSSVVVHELAHSLLARRLGVDVHEILLLPIGGVSKMEALPQRPGDELRITAAGPLSSYVLAAAAAVVTMLLGDGLWPISIGSGPVAPQLFWMNVMLGTFNLVPAFPLDGGRLLRAGLAQRMDLESATRRAARIGHIIAGVMIAVGLLVDVWLALIGAFIYAGASAELTATQMHVRLTGLRVRDLMVVDPMVVPADVTRAELERLLHVTTQREFPMVADRGYVGMLDADGTVRAGAAALPPNEPLEEAVQKVMEAGLRTAAVVEDGHVVGTLHVADVLRLSKQQPVRLPVAH